MALTPQEEEYLESIYFNPEHAGSFGGENKLYRVIKEEGRFPITHKKLRKWLSSQETYTLHKPARRTYSRRPIIVSGIGRQADSDLMDMSKFSRFNQQTRFILVYIDVFSKKLWTKPLKSKSGLDVTEALRKIFKEGGRCDQMRTDKGTEFVNKNVQSFLAKNKVHHFVTQNPSIKSSIAERTIKNLKKKIYKYMNQFQTYEYLKALPKLTLAYNLTFHRSIGMSPSQVSEENESQVFTKLYKEKSRKLYQKGERLKIKTGDWVRVSYLTSKFSREYDNQFSGEQYQVVSASLRQGRPAYQLQDFNGEILEGYFYPEEIQLLHIPVNQTYRIEQVIRSRINKKNKKKEYLVKWLNWGERWNSWVSEDEIRDIPKPPVGANQND